MNVVKGEKNSLEYIKLEIDNDDIKIKTNLTDEDEIIANLTASLIAYAIQCDISKELLILAINRTYN
jgi:hypothetical protein